MRKIRCCLLLALSGSWSASALAVDYVVSSKLPPCAASWNSYPAEPQRFYCPPGMLAGPKSDIIKLQSGDTVSASATGTTLESLCGFALAGNNTIGVNTAAGKVNLNGPQAGNATMVSCPNGTAFTIGAGSAIYGNLTSANVAAFYATIVAQGSSIVGNVLSYASTPSKTDYRSIDFTDVAVTGNVTVSATASASQGISLTRGSVSGSVSTTSVSGTQNYNNYIITDGTTIGGNVGGSVITMNGGRVGGAVTGFGGPVTLTNTNVVGIVRSYTPPVIITGGILDAAVSADSAAAPSVCSIELNNVTMTAKQAGGTGVTAQTATNCTVTISNSTLGSNLNPNWVNVVSTGTAYIKNGSVVWGAVGAGLQDPMTLVEAGSIVMDFCRVYDAKGVAITSTANPAAFGYRCGGGAGAPAPDGFTAFEPSTPAGAVSGPIHTKLTGTAFPLTIQAVSKGAVTSGFSNSVKLELLANGTPGKNYGANNCPTSFTTLQTVASLALIGGRAVYAGFKSTTAARDVRVRIGVPASAPTKYYCSTDSFAIRPPAFAVTSSNAVWNQSLSSTPTFRAGTDAFNLTVNAGVAGYDGTPQFNPAGLGVASDGDAPGVLAGAFETAGGGALSGEHFTYSEVPGFQFAADAVYDGDFTAIDQNGGCVVGSSSNILANGLYGCNIGSPASGWFGRFIPDHFEVALTPACAGVGATPFTYSGQAFGDFQVRAMNGLTPPTPTRNYAAATKVAKTVRLYDATGAAGSFSYTQDGAPGAPLAASNAFVKGVIDGAVFPGLAFSFTLKRSAPATIRLRAEELGGDGVTSQGYEDAALALVRSGQLQLFNAFGAANLPIPMTMQAQYWTGDSWLLNTDDSCTALTPANFALSSQGQPTSVTTAQSVSAFKAGAATLLLTPTDGLTASIDVAANLGWLGVDVSCLAWHGGAPAAGNPYWLRSQNGSCPAAMNWASDPSARVTFGARTRRVIHSRDLFR